MVDNAGGRPIAVQDVKQPLVLQGFLLPCPVAANVVGLVHVEIQKSHTQQGGCILTMPRVWAAILKNQFFKHNGLHVVVQRIVVATNPQQVAETEEWVVEAQEREHVVTLHNDLDLMHTAPD
jgi:hypothetical protein